MNTISRVNWDLVHGQEIFKADGCWQTCNGGFCCSNACHPDLEFQFIPTHGTTLIYLDQEYDHLRRAGRAPNEGVKELIFDFGCPSPLRLIHVPCSLLGQCSKTLERPLICKLYPFIPILDQDGNFEDLRPASIFDLTMSIRQETIPCSMLKHRKWFEALWSDSIGLIQVMRHPYLIFYSRAVKHFSDIYSQKLLQEDGLSSLAGPFFWKRWEIDYLTGKLIDGNALKERLREDYLQLQARYPGFDL